MVVCGMSNFVKISENKLAARVFAHLPPPRFPRPCPREGTSKLDYDYRRVLHVSRFHHIWASEKDYNPRRILRFLRVFLPESEKIVKCCFLRKRILQKGLQMAVGVRIMCVCFYLCCFTQMSNILITIHFKGSDLLS